MTLESNKAVVRRYIEEVINRGNLALIDSIFAPELAERVKSFLAGGENEPFPDGQEEIRDIIAEGNTVMVRWIYRATHLGEFMGIPPTRKRIEITGYGTYYLENDRIVWDTMSMDWDDAMEQLGVTFKGPDS
jgi:predicted ester cyclase